MKIYVKTFYFNGADLIGERERLGLTQAQFAEIAGWRQPYQAKLETDISHCLTDQIEEGLLRHGIILEKIGIFQLSY